MRIAGGLFIRNDSTVKYGIHHVFDRNHPLAPVGAEPTEVLAPGESVVLLRNAGVEYVIGHYDSVAAWRIVREKALKNGTLRRDLGPEHRAWSQLKPE